MKSRRRNYTHEVHIVAFDQLAPIRHNVFYLELFGDVSRMFAVTTSNGNYARSHTVAKARYLGRPREAGSDDADSDLFGTIK
jgi:hypothetical protein